MVLQVLADARSIATTSMSNERNSAAGPTPDSFSNCGELIGPPQRIISRRALATCSRSPRPIRDANRASPFERMRVASAWVTTSRFARFIAGREIGVGGRQRTPSFTVMSKRAKTLLPLAIKVGADRIAGLPGRLDPGLVAEDCQAPMRVTSGPLSPR